MRKEIDMNESDFVNYRLNARGYSSIMRGIPFSEENLNAALDHVTRVYESNRSKFYVMYRGPRTGLGNCTLKKDALWFDLYSRNY